MAKVYVEKRGKKWQYSFDVAKIGGRRKRITKCGFATKSEADKAGIKAVAEYFDTGTYSEPSKLSYCDFLNKWIEDYCRTNLKAVSVKNYEKIIRLYINPKLGMYKMPLLSASTLQSFIDLKAKESFSRNSLSVMKGILSGSLNYAVKLGYIKHNPMLSVKLPSPRNEAIQSRSEPNVYINEERVKEIFKRFPEGHPAHLPLMLGYKCGMRLGEVFALTWDCVNFTAQTIKITKQVQWNSEDQCWYFSYPKYASIREIDIDNGLSALLLRAKEKQERAKNFYAESFQCYYADSKQRLNNSSQGNKIELVNIRDDGSYIQPRIMQHASSVIHYNLGFKEFSFHSLRHTHATMLFEAGFDIKYILERLGHSKINVTVDTYLHLTEKTKTSNRESLEQLFQMKKNDNK